MEPTLSISSLSDFTNLPPLKTKPTTQEVNWTRYTNSDFLRYEVYRGTAADVTNESGTLVTEITNQNKLSYLDTGLSPSTNYYYKVYVVAVSGEYVDWQDISSNAPTKPIIDGYNAGDRIVTYHGDETWEYDGNWSQKESGGSPIDFPSKESVVDKIADGSIGLDETLSDATNVIYSVFADVDYIYSGTGDNNVYVYDKTFTLHETLTTPTDSVFGVFADENYIYVSSRDNNVYIYNKSDFTLNTTLSEADRYMHSIYADDVYVYVGCDDFNTYIYDKSDFTLNTTLTDATNGIYSVFADSGYIYVGSLDENVYVYDKSDFTLNTTLTDSTGYIYSIYGDVDYVYAGSSDNNIYVYNKSDFSLNTTLTDATGQIRSVHADADYIYGGAGSGSIYVYDKTFTLQKTLTDPTNDVRSIYGDFEYIYAGSDDNNLYIYQHTNITTNPLTLATSNNLAFGGHYGDNIPTNETWELTDTGWVQLSPTTNPPARVGHGFAGDIVFGGFDGTNYLGDTWRWTGTDWVSVSTTNAPPARRDFAMVEADDGAIYIYGGEGVDGLLNDFWKFDGDWVEVSADAGLPGISEPTRTVGYNLYGQLGDGTTVDKSTPVDIGLTGVQGVAAGNNHIVFLMQDGTVKTVGRNNYGQLGDGTTTDKSTPVDIGLTGVQGVAAGAYHTVFLMQDGTVRTVGRNNYGQLGDGTTVNKSTLVDIGLTGVQGVAAGVYHTVFLMTDGTVRTVGQNNGQLGDGTTVDKSTPVDIGLTGVQSVAGGYYHTIFLMDDGTVRTVGWNNYGQLGDGTTVDKSTPVDIGLTGVQGVAAGYYHTVFLGSNINGRRNPILSPNLFVFGGQTEGTYHGDTYNLTDFTEQTFTTTPDPRAGGLLTKFGQDLILIGGHNAAELSDVWRLNYAGDAYNPSNEEASQTTSYGFAKYRRRHGEIARHYDNIIKSTAPDTFFDAEPQLVVNDTQRALMHFNTDYFKDGSVIDKATLRLNSEGGTGTLSTLEIAPITSEWYQTATWNNMPGTGTPITVNVDPTTMGYVELDITDIVKDWNSGTPNRGIMIKKADETDTNEYVFSSMEATSGLPEFEIDYLLEGIASDDTEVDYDFYTAPENVIVRTKEVGTVLGGTSKVFELELINTNTLGTVQTELSFDGTNPDDTIELSTVTPFSPVATPYDIGPMASGEKRTVYVRVSPGNASVGDRTFYLKVAAKVSN